MGAFRVHGGRSLNGSIYIPSAKNAVLPIMAASVLIEGEVRLLDTPQISDVKHMRQILEKLGVRTRLIGRTLVMDTAGISGWEMPEKLSKCLRSSIFLLGALLSRFGRATVTYPGGCEIGLRPIDLHLHGLRALGVKITEENGLIYCDGSKLRAGEILLDYPSVGATENVMLAAVSLHGTTVVHNAAREPEIVDLQRFLNHSGAAISGAGSETITICGGKTLHPVVYRPIADRIVAGTYLCAAAAAGGGVTIDNSPNHDLSAVFMKLRAMGCTIEESLGRCRLAAPERLTPVEISTCPYPGFPTDMQSQMTALCCLADGVSRVTENVFENRFSFVPDLRRMGADIYVGGRIAVIRGGKRLSGASVQARDLRGGAAIVIAALSARGESLVTGTEFIDRGYESMEKALTALGAEIVREKITREDENG
ncbi:MAG: UDP-N-acetylglucosamine 1-carboxyvinyltransferase [Eubacteriales bacterium]|nr:UDP-N-acetylglucosamine 1-carboxyvinyltransferase [Eubacteriales bacterium]MDD3880820.1 UDP-N-acetylglucosamine 1-carboxyvinyltransferase [Eubacteriales bacterium]MDD4511813.1 UDP-N-acetylglucosamine 1-carboxyvinyltransferase [Eubacteriales bacterium]